MAYGFIGNGSFAFPKHEEHCASVPNFGFLKQNTEHQRRCLFQMGENVLSRAFFRGRFLSVYMVVVTAGTCVDSWNLSLRSGPSRGLSCVTNAALEGEDMSSPLDLRAPFFAPPPPCFALVGHGANGLLAAMDVDARGLSLGQDIATSSWHS